MPVGRGGGRRGAEPSHRRATGIVEGGEEASGTNGGSRLQGSLRRGRRRATASCLGEWVVQIPPLKLGGALQGQPRNEQTKGSRSGFAGRRTSAEGGGTQRRNRFRHQRSAPVTDFSCTVSPCLGPKASGALGRRRLRHRCRREVAGRGAEGTRGGPARRNRNRPPCRAARN